MKCLICKNGVMKESREKYLAQQGQNCVIIENVPCHKCEQCGEIVYNASVMERIDEIIENEGKSLQGRQRNFSESLHQAIHDSRNLENLNGPFDDAASAVSSMLDG